MNRILFLISVILMALISCNKDNGSTVKSSILDSVDVNYSILCQGDLSGSGKQGLTSQMFIINHDSTWNKLLLQMANNNPSSPKFQCGADNIDFAKSTILAMFDSVYNYGGHSIDIKNIVETKNSLEVNLYHLRLGDLTAVITQPFNIVKLNKVSKPIYFKFK